MHFTASALVFNDDGALLLAHDRGSGSWRWPGGPVESGESLAAAARRSVGAATGIPVVCLADPPYAYGSLVCEPRPWRILRHLPHDGGLDGSEREGVDHLFLCRAADAERWQAPAEGAECRWVPLARLQEYRTVPELSDIVAEAVRTARLHFDSTLPAATAWARSQWGLDRDCAPLPS